MDTHFGIMKKALEQYKAKGPLYGSPDENFVRAAEIASLWLNKLVTPRDVVLILASVKMSRTAVTPDHEDSFVDICNYVAFGAAFSRPNGSGNTVDERALAGDLDASLKAEINGA